MVPKLLAKLEGRMSTLEGKTNTLNSEITQVKGETSTLKNEITKVKGQPVFRCESLRKEVNNPSYHMHSYSRTYSRKFARSATGIASITTWPSPAATWMSNINTKLDKITVSIQTMPASTVNIWAMVCGV